MLADPRAAAARTAEIVAARPGWVWPWWLERQVDPASRAWMPAGPLGLLPNATGRSWTRIGALDGTATVIVDPRGLVCPANARWSLDWWIGADDRWHLPSREVAVRQNLVEHAPVVETVMRVPGGDVRHRAFVARVPSTEGGGHAVVVEIENDSALPCAVGLALRPATVDGIGHVSDVAVDGKAISIDGRPVVLLDRPVARAAVGDGAIDSAAIAMNGGAKPPPSTTGCPDGLAQAVAIVPLAHRATMRLVLPADVHDAPLQTFPSVLPPATNVASGWTAIVDGGARLVPPPGRVADAIAAARRQLLVFGAAETAAMAAQAVRSAGAGRSLDRLLIAKALDELAHHDEAARLIATWLAGLVRGRVIVDGAELANVAAALAALERHHVLAADDALSDASADAVAAGASWLANAVSHADADGDALVWATAGLEAATRLLRELGRDRHAASDAAEATGAATIRRDAALERMTSGAARNVSNGVSSDPDSIDGARRLLAFVATGLLDPCHAAVDAALVPMEMTSLVSAGPDLGLDPAATLDVSTVVLLRAAAAPTATVSSRSDADRADDISARLLAALDAASPTGAWPTLLHPQLKTGCGGDGHDAAITARFLRFARRLFVTVAETPLIAIAASGPPATSSKADIAPGSESLRANSSVLALCPILLGDWRGQGIEAHDLPTPPGRLAFAVRWHGDRPAVLWEVQPHRRLGSQGAPTLELRAPGLTRTWSATEHRGETLLAQ